MDFENSNPSGNYNSQNNQNLGQSLLGGLIQSIADDTINYGSRYLEQKVDQWAQNL